MRIYLLILVLCRPISATASQPGPPTLFMDHCASCHGDTRFGLSGPALLPESLERLGKDAAAALITDGLPATQMPAFKDKLTPQQIRGLVDFIYTPPPAPLVWGSREIRASHVVQRLALVAGDASMAKPAYSADPLNLFLVVEAGDHHVTVLDGDKLEPIHRFKSRYALHGGLKYSSDGRFAYLASRDGWISKFDMYLLDTVAEIRAGINTRNAAVSGDDRYVMVGNYLPRGLVVLDARDLSLIKVIPTRDDFANSSRVSGVYVAPPRSSFIVALKDLKEIWEISYADEPEAVYRGLMHDYQMGEGMAETGRFPIRRIKLDDYVDDFFFDQSYQHLVGAARDGMNGEVVNLIVGRKIADIDVPGMPHLGSGITWKYHDTTVLATPNLRDGIVSVIDMRTWKTIKKIETLGPGFFIRSHENSPYAWVDVFFGEHKDVVHVIDKQSLKIVKTLRPVPGKTSAHVEFTRDGKYALLSIWDQEGFIIVYDARTLREVKRLPMKKPVGKYNVYNKITRSEGTSH